MKIGYIGLGSMGGALARHLVANHQLTVWDLNGAAAAAFEKLGVAVAPSAAELARQCDIVLLCLPRSSDVNKLLFSPGGLAEGLTAGKLVIDQTSGLPGETREIAARLAAQGVDLVDAPVSGGVVGAAAGTITIMLSGPDALCQKALPVLKAISPNVFRCGDRVGDGMAMKLVNNLLSAGCRIAALEVVALARKMGLSLAAITAALNQGHAANRTTKLTLQSIVDGKVAVSNFAMALMVKDMNQAIQLGMEVGSPTPLTNIVRGLMQIGVNTLGQDVQFDKVLDLIGSMAGTRIVAPADAAAAVPTTPDKAAEALRIIENVVASCNELLTYEAVSIGVKYGLKLADMATLIVKSTGWSVATERILPTLSQGRPTAPAPLQGRVQDLKTAAALAMEWGAPLMLANTVCALSQMGANTLGASANVDDMARLYESTAGVKLTGA